MKALAGSQRRIVLAQHVLAHPERAPLLPALPDLPRSASYYIYLLGDLAFLPVEVLLVTVIIHRLLDKQEKQTTLGKLNMVIGAFFSEVGTELLRLLAECDRDREKTSTIMKTQADWTPRAFAAAGLAVRRNRFDPEASVQMD